MKIQRTIHALHVTSDYRGDHAADVMIAIDVNPEWTVDELVERVLGDTPSGDHIQLRIARHPVLIRKTDPPNPVQPAGAP